MVVYRVSRERRTWAVQVPLPLLFCSLQHWGNPCNLPTDDVVRIADNMVDPDLMYDCPQLQWVSF